jgi:hypothetical protein
MKRSNIEKDSRVPEAVERVHGHGTITSSPVTMGMIEKRARELAVISGRDSHHVIESDREQAKKELLGSDSADAPADDSGIVASGMGAPPTSRGKMAKKFLPTDDEVESQTVQEGVDEAEHTTMVAANRNHGRNN